MYFFLYSKQENINTTDGMVVHDTIDRYMYCMFTHKIVFDNISRYCEEHWKYNALSRAFLANSEMFEKVVKHCFECLIYCVNQNYNYNSVQILTGEKKS